MPSVDAPELNELFFIYQKVFTSPPGDTEPQQFQRLAAACLAKGITVGTPEYDAFRGYLKAKSNNPDWNPSAEQLEALSYLLGTDRNASLVKPWEGGPTW
jgi:hypothetical protein